jgi:hypothetical protein
LGSLLFANAIAQPPLGTPGQAGVGVKSRGEQAPAKIKPAADQLKMGDLEQFFQPPPEYTNDFGSYRSPLEFYDGRSVTSAADWPARRREILDRWHKTMGPWPPLVEQPKNQFLT